MRGATARASLKSSVATVTAAAVLMVAMPGATMAQDNGGTVSTYRLPDPKQTSTPRVQGPVDPDNPYPVPSSVPRSERAPVITPSPTPAPRITIPAPQPSAGPAERQRPARPTPAPSAQADDASRPTVDPTAKPSTPPATLPADAATSPAPAVQPGVEPSAAPVASDAPAPAPAATNWWMLVALAGVVLALGAFVMLRRRRRVAEEEEAVLDPVPEIPTPPSLAVALPPQPRPAVEVPTERADPVLPLAAESPLLEPLAVATSFVAQAVRLSLVYATVQYELEITNLGEIDLPALQVRADLASAHASLGTREQLAPDPAQMEAKHTLAALAPDETVKLKGEVRVPLQQVVPLVKGNARFFVPLVRFAILGQDGAAVRRVFTVGPRDPGSNAITSVRLDAGPRNLRELDAREIEAARGFTLDPMVAHS